MKVFRFGALLAAVAGLAAGSTVAFADEVAREALHARRLDLASLRGLAHGMYALASGHAKTSREQKRRGVVDTIVSYALFFTLVTDGMRREPRHTRLVIGAAGVAALSIAPLLPPRRPLLAVTLAFVAGAAAAAAMTRVCEVRQSGSTRHVRREVGPSLRAPLAA
jgi:hypothetical protein